MTTESNGNSNTDPASVLAAPAKASEPSEANQKEDKPQQHPSPSMPKLRIDVLQLIFDALVAVVGIFALCIYYGQLGQMIAQTKLLSDQAAAQSRDSVETSKRLEQQLKALQDQAAAAQASANAIQQQMRREQRAWVTMSSNDLSGPFETGKPYLVTVTIKNFGKSPARNVVLQISTSVFQIRNGEVVGHKPRIEFGRLTKQDSRSVIEPSGADSKTFSVSGVPPIITDDDIKLLESGQVRPSVIGKISYHDVFGHAHWTTFCFYLAPNKNHQACAYGNEIDPDLD